MQKKMNEVIKWKFIAKLRSGLRQITGSLASHDGNCMGYCGMGILALVGQDYGIGQYGGVKGDNWTQDGSLRGWSGLSQEAESKIINGNDSKGWTFAEMADWVEKEL